jgi:hypothetical protein
MQLYDPKLKFARDLIGHWLGIRGGALVLIRVCDDSSGFESGPCQPLGVGEPATGETVP